MKQNLMRISAALLGILLLGMMAFLLKQHKTISEYTYGFDIQGTYTTGTESEYLAFQDDKKAYSYRQFGEVSEGTYAKTDSPNIYILKMKDTPAKYIVLGKEALTCIEDENTASYVKLASGAVFINAESSE